MLFYLSIGMLFLFSLSFFLIPLFGKRMLSNAIKPKRLYRTCEKAILDSLRIAVMVTDNMRYTNNIKRFYF